MQDVLDHCPEPLAVLAKCHRMLKPGGLLVIKVHNISCLYAKLTGPRFYAIIPPSHLFYYNARTLTLAAKKTGFEVVEGRFIAHLLRVSTVFMRLSRSNKDSIFYRIYRALEGSLIGRIKIHKNLHDIITVFAIRQPD
jgi:2-polyprenyl-3-methyl-5-hydroxy-6-metoxy-1,4-benzoquinol methylase